MSKPPPRKKQKLTELAEKYGHPVGPQHAVLRHIVPFKSGLTPIAIRPFDIIEDKARFKLQQEYQRARFMGFTTMELHSMEALAPTIKLLKAIDLRLSSFPIHSLYEKRHWDKYAVKHVGLYPLRRGLPGFYEVKNPLVWNAIKPSLRLASPLLTHAHSYPWWDALLEGKYEMIHPDHLPDGHKKRKFARFRLRGVSEYSTDSARKKVAQFFKDPAGGFDLGFTSARVNHRTGLPNEEYCYGRTVDKRHNRGRAMILLSYELVEPLLRTDLNDAERALDIYRLGCTLLHETAHLLFGDQLLRRYPEIEDEPYFEDEVQSELGFSLEKTLFGGVARGLFENDIPGNDVTSAGAVFTTDFPSRPFSGYRDHVPTLIPRPPDFNTSYFFPVPVWFFVDLCSIDFWDYHVKRFGREATQMGPKVLGSSFAFLDDGEIRKGMKHFDLAFDKTVPLTINPSMSPGTVTAIKLENARRQQALRVRQKYVDYLDNIENVVKSQQRVLMKSSGVSDTVVDVLEEEDFCCPRFAEIKAYLIEWRMELAFDTMTFKIAEHTLLRYIHEEGGLQLTADEWRDFLLVAHSRRTLFNYDSMGCGVVGRIENGWGVPPTRKHHPKPSSKPSKDILQTFKLVAKYVIRDHDFLGFNDYYDYDAEDFLIRMNSVMKNRPELHIPVMLSRPITRFSHDLFYDCLWWCDYSADMFVFGPKGVIRWMGTFPQKGGGMRKVLMGELQKAGDKIVDKCMPM